MSNEDVEYDEERPERRIRVDVYHHFPDGPIGVDLGTVVIGDLPVTLTGGLTVTVEEPPPSQVPTSLKLVPGTPVRIHKEPPVMPDFILEDNQEVACEVVVLDAIGNIVAGDAVDAGSLTATPADSTTLTATVSADQSSVTVAAVGPEVTDNVVTLAGTLNGAPLTGSLAFDVVASAPSSLGLVPGTPTTVTPTA